MLKRYLTSVFMFPTLDYVWLVNILTYQTYLEVEPLAVSAGVEVRSEVELVITLGDLDSLLQVTRLKPALEQESLRGDVRSHWLREWWWGTSSRNRATEHEWFILTLSDWSVVPEVVDLIAWFIIVNKNSVIFSKRTRLSFFTWKWNIFYNLKYFIMKLLCWSDLEDLDILTGKVELLFSRPFHQQLLPWHFNPINFLPENFCNQSVFCRILIMIEQLKAMIHMLSSVINNQGLWMTL